MSATPDNTSHDSEAIDRMIDRALVGVDDSGHSSQSPAQPTEWDLVAALLQRTLVEVHGRSEQPPAALVERLRATAAESLSSPAPPTTQPAASPPPSAARERVNEVVDRTSPIATLTAWAGWLAAAACLALAAFAWLPDRTPPPAQQRAELLAKAPDVVTVPLANPFGDEAATNATGDIVWSDLRQRGFIRLSGMQVNDPTQNQYQLWIFQQGSLADLNSLEPHPVDGGVFDVTSTGEVIIPIDAKLRVQTPTAFAITVEKPGGVVVSDRSRIPLVGNAVAARSATS